MKIGFSSSRLSSIAWATSSVASVPVRRDRLVALLGSDVAVVVLALDRFRLLLVALEDFRLLGRRDHVVLGDRDPGLTGVVEAEVLERVEHLRDRTGAP